MNTLLSKIKICQVKDVEVFVMSLPQLMVKTQHVGGRSQQDYGYPGGDVEGRLILVHIRYNNISVMKQKQFGINMGSLSEAQRKMCVQFLANSNVEIDEQNEEYVATLKISTDKIKEFSKVSGKKKTLNYSNGKKPLNKVVKVNGLEKLMDLHPTVEVYIYPKKMQFHQILQIIENIYHFYWSSQKSTKTYQPFPQYFYESISKHFNSKIKLDQFMVNFIDTINHYQYKYEGVGLFVKFLSSIYNAQQLAYYLVLRALLQQINSQKILDTRNKSTIFPDFHRLRWNPYEGQLAEEGVKQFLNVSLIDKDINKVFEKLTQKMYFSEQKKNNYIQIFDFLSFMLDEFVRHVQSPSLNLQLSYSHDSSLNELFQLTSNRNQELQPLQTEFNVHLEPLVKEVDQNHPKFIDCEFVDQVSAKLAEMCTKMKVDPNQQEELVENAKMCVRAIIEGDKAKWIETVGLEGNEAELYYIQNVQKQYNKVKQTIKSPIVLNSLTKKVINGPGIRKMFHKYLRF